MGIVLCTLVAFFLILVGVLLAFSHGTPKPFLDDKDRPVAGSISEKTRVQIGGVDQGMFIEGVTTTKPVLLFLHGGPGMPEYFLSRDHPTGFEKHFTVCWWDQRGSGLSYRSDIPPETMTVEQLISDTLEVTNYLRDRFTSEKIFLMAHSGGSFIGIQAAARAPELFHGYVGVAQMTYQLESERLAYDYMLARFRENGNMRMVRRLVAASRPETVPLPAAYDSLRDEAMHSLGVGTTHTMRSVISGVFLPSWLCPAYTVGEKIAIWRGKVFSKNLLWNTMMGTDLTGQVTELGLPVHLCHGLFDYTVSYTRAKEYYKRLKAPLKGFYTFEESAHSPMFEEPVRMQEILRADVLAGSVDLADAC